MISVNNVGVRFGSIEALQNISFSVEKGEYIGLIGPNGAGKSTLLKVLLGFIPPSTGTVSKQKNISFGYVPQNYLLNTKFCISVQEVLEMAATSSFFWRKKTAIIFVSHEIESIVSRCHRVLCLNKKLHEGCHPVEFSKGNRESCSVVKTEKTVRPIHHHHSLL